MVQLMFASASRLFLDLKAWSSLGIDAAPTAADFFCCIFLIFSAAFGRNNFITLDWIDFFGIFVNGVNDLSGWTHEDQEDRQKDQSIEHSQYNETSEYQEEVPDGKNISIFCMTTSSHSILL